MGDTARPNVFSSEPRPFFDYFYQNFAQVTNPPLDYLRERNITDLRVFLGRRPNIFFAKDLLPLEEALELPGPVLSLGQMRFIEALSHKRPSQSHIIPKIFPMVFERDGGVTGFRPAVDALAASVLQAVEKRDKRHCPLRRIGGLSSILPSRVHRPSRGRPRAERVRASSSDLDRRPLGGGTGRRTTLPHSSGSARPPSARTSRWRSSATTRTNRSGAFRPTPGRGTTLTRWNPVFSRSCRRSASPSCRAT